MSNKNGLWWRGEVPIQPGGKLGGKVENPLGEWGREGVENPVDNVHNSL